MVDGESALEREIRLRLAAMDWLSSRNADVFRYEDVRDFRFEGQNVPLLDFGRGIRKPAHMQAALSIRTVHTPPGAVPPYADSVGTDGLLRYKIRGDNPNQAENVALRRAMEQEAALIWFVGVSQGSYLARYPVYLVAEEPREQQFVVALDDAQRRMAQIPGPLTEQDRRWVERITWQRLHQPLFRARVLDAYQRSCAMCHLRHASLLDASHILPDRHELGQPVVPNGLALCKIHHAAFDQNIVGVSPDLEVRVRGDILSEIDGPMLRHGLQALNGSMLSVPIRRTSRPTRERLEIRFSEFLAA